MKKTTALSVIGALTICSAEGLAANEQPTAGQDIEALKQQKERLQLELDLDKIKLEKLKLITDALPSFEGKAEADKNTGEFEAAIIANASLAHVAGQFAERFEYPEGDKTKTLILAGDEPFSFGLPNALAAEMRSLRKRLIDPKICGAEDCDYEEAVETSRGPKAVSTAITAVTAVAGLLRSDVSLTTLSVSDTTDAKFAQLLASALGDKAKTLGGNPGIRVSAKGLKDYNDNDQWDSDDNLSKKFVWLLQARPKLNDKLAKLKKNDERIKAVQKWLSDFAAFEVRVTKVDGVNGSPLGRAVNQEKLSEETGAVVRVYASAGGRLKKSAHLSTALFGADPFRVSAGLRAYAIRYGTSNEDSRSEIDGYLEYACTSKNLHFHQLQDLKVRTGGKTESDAIKCWELGSSGEWEPEQKTLEQSKLDLAEVQKKLRNLRTQMASVEKELKGLESQADSAGGAPVQTRTESGE
ncbi:MAG: hypothetical protein AAF250_12290 [Pseudomonadota bacterium]